jgi:mono/diheme cytochrome c family protein
MPRKAALTGLFLLFGLTMPSQALLAHSELEESIERGAALATEKCSSCHDVSGDGLSPNPKAPLFKNITRKYPASYLQEAFAEGVIVGKHGQEMPQFELEPGQIDDLVAYIDSVGGTKKSR